MIPCRPNCPDCPVYRQEDDPNDFLEVTQSKNMLTVTVRDGRDRVSAHSLWTDEVKDLVKNLNAWLEAQ